MITGDYDKLQEIAKFNVCSVHHTPLEISWFPKQWTLRCGGDGGHYPDAVTRQLSLTEEHKAGVELPEPIKSNVEKGMRRRAMQQSKQFTDEKYALIPKQDLGTGELLVPELLQALVVYAERYHLDPERGHVVLMYGKPYITIDGYLYHARKSNKEFTMESRPMTIQEKTDGKFQDDDHAWLATVTFVKTGAHCTGVGVVNFAETTEKSKRDPTRLAAPVVAAHPQLLCQKRAEWQALRRAFPIRGA